MEDMYAFMEQYLEEDFEVESVLKESPRGTVTKLRQRASHRRYICRRYLEKAEIYFHLLGKQCPYLPPVTYEGPLTMDTRTANLYGCEEEGKKTVFTDTVSVQTREPYPAEFYSLEFRGDGGCGIRCSEGLRTEYCLFTGWDIGVDVNNGGWISVRNSAFVGNGTGLRFDSESSTYASPNYENVVFAENETGMDIIHVPGGLELNYINPVFDNNQTDFTDPGGCVKISG